MSDIAKTETMFGKTEYDMKQINEKLDTMNSQFTQLKVENKKLRTKLEKQEDKIVMLERDSEEK